MSIQRNGTPCPYVTDAKPISVTVRAARDLTGLGNTTLWKLIGDGTLATVRVGRRRLILFKSIEKLIEPTSEGAIT